MRWSIVVLIYFISGSIRGQHDLVLRFTDANNRSAISQVRCECQSSSVSMETFLSNEKGFLLIPGHIKCNLFCGHKDYSSDTIPFSTILPDKINVRTLKRVKREYDTTQMSVEQNGNLVSVNVVLPSDVQSIDSVSIDSMVGLRVKIPERIPGQDLGAELLAQQTRAKVHLIWLLDRSGSMRMRSNEEILRTLLYEANEQLGDSDLVSVVIFGSRLEVLLEGRSRAQFEIDSVLANKSEIGSMTKVQDALNVAYNLAGSTSYNSDVQQIILVSDGSLMVYNTELKRRIERNVAQNTYLQIFGINVYEEAVQGLVELARLGGGEFLPADNLSKKNLQRLLIHFKEIR